eukprot:TRINITY_DN21015_c0_g1_i1.p1 TRINITY_DN21015_c0_g1~~TRINITY_DN21015_c0_g1_i1.p1  ORF type:complete len:283 (+),score=24.36 TRINITY_DN21015_c0_g1_i1:99-851(+)
MAGSGIEMREGDWTCSSCDNLNYACRLVCNRCGGEKTTSGGYGPAKGNGGQPRVSPYGVPPAPPPSGGKPGDWTCPSCNNHNYVHRTQCNRCKLPKMGSPEMMQGVMQGMQGAYCAMGVDPAMNGMTSLRPGDWLCRACNNHNYSSREACNRCHIPKTIYIADSGMRDGDWLCPQCQNHNYASKTACNKCQRPKGQTPIHTNNKGFGGGGGGGGGGDKEMRPGDWICAQCNNHNYASKTHCNKCSVSKPF